MLYDVIFNVFYGVVTNILGYSSPINSSVTQLMYPKKA